MKLNRLSFFGLLLSVSCIVPEEARMLKKATKDWRKAAVVFDTFSDAPFSGSFLNLMDNGKFESTTSGIRQEFNAGSWSVTFDTIVLHYVDVNQQVVNSRKVLMDRETSTIDYMDHPLPIQLRPSIVVNKL